MKNPQIYRVALHSCLCLFYWFFSITCMQVVCHTAIDDDVSALPRSARMRTVKHMAGSHKRLANCRLLVLMTDTIYWAECAPSGSVNLDYFGWRIHIWITPLYGDIGELWTSHAFSPVVAMTHRITRATACVS